VISVPSQVVSQLAKDLAPLAKPGQLVLNVAKGLQAGTHRRMSQVITEKLGSEFAPFVGSMGGPAIAIDMARHLPLAIIIAVPDPTSCGEVQGILQSRTLKVEATSDVVGLELCATLKNIYAIALGICDGIGHGTNYKAFLSSVALAEMKAINVALGGQPETVYGLAGVGDLLTTGFSAHSRNRTLGEKLGAESDWKHFLDTNTVEGVVACQAISELVGERELHLPLLNTVHGILFDPQPAPAALYRFFQDFSYD
jgi:glycerol-3-phosphate dehydrogenase (NAD(P)+)